MNPLPPHPVSASSTDGPTISLSVVSHSQGRLIASLLDDLAKSDWHGGSPFEVIVTINIPEDEAWLPSSPPFPLKVLRNARPKGFGANHNAAFRAARGAFFAVVNPDIRLADFRVADLLAALELPDAGVCGPVVLAPGGKLEDSARRFPTIAGLARRRLRRRQPEAAGSDYSPPAGVLPVDWLAGMFLLFPAPVYRAIGGFDERFFMYLEDVEISRFLRRRGLRTLWVGTTAVVHDASRASHRSLRHMRYHLVSAARYFLLNPCR
ncbi:glycosyltransferase [Sphingomonas sp. ac-8]|uniref:glycosyltransferase n=1 Tax=Sphingomonas sp. ac-8 TaxID=3242977 RepID=UPI003A7F9BB4